VCTQDAAIVGITETWLNPTVLDAELLPPKFNIHRKDRTETRPDTRGGGLLLAIDASLPSKRRRDLEPNCEILVCEVKTERSGKLALALCYRPPDFDRAQFNAHLEETLFSISADFATLLVFGDFNLPDIDWTHPEHAHGTDVDFINLFASYAFIQRNSVPSNIHMHMLDLIFCNQDNLVKNVMKVDCCFHTDHTILSFDLALIMNEKPSFKRTVYNYKRGNYDNLCMMLNNSLLLDAISSAINIDAMWECWYNALLAVLDQCIPKITIKCSNDPAWFDGEMRHMTNKKKTAWKRAKKSNTATAWAKFRAVRNETCALVRVKQESFLNSLAVTCKENPKRFWSYFKSKTKNHSLPDEIHNDNLSCSDPQDKATMFNSYFVSLFSSNQVMQFPSIPNNVVPIIPDPVFTSYEIDVILAHLDVNSACGPSGISPVILKKCHYLISPSLAVIFNVSIQTSKIPSEWKRANVTPVFKKSDKHSVINYRPISLLCCVSKVMERCIFNHLYFYVKNTLHSLQHGFIKGRSCSTQLLKVYNFIGSVLDRGGQIDIIFLDFTKAFDCISHELLLFKLQHFYGINGNLLAWIKDYLYNRIQRVAVENKCSDWLHVLSGVPQGSILGPLFFLLFINDLPSVASNCQTALFADDSKCFKEITCENDCILLQNDINSMYQWSKTWQMNFNPSKCKVLSITRQHNPCSFQYEMNGTPLEHVGSFKDLGVIIDQTLSFNSHVDEVILKCNKTCGFIKRSIGFNASTCVKLQLYKSLCLSILDFCSPVWSPFTKMNIQKLERVQRSMSRFILLSNDISYNDRCMILEILPLSFRREVTDLLFLFKCMHGLIRCDFSPEITLVNSSSGLRSANEVLLSAKPVRTEMFISSYFNRIVHLWNVLPFTIRDCSSFNVFKQKLLSYYKDKIPSYNVDNSCTWTSTCRCQGFYHF